MSKYRLVVWCASCRNDDGGCFGGGSEIIGAAFESWEDAAKAGEQYCDGLPYLYCIEQDDPQ
jgi:hypothetical protein